YHQAAKIAISLPHARFGQPGKIDDSGSFFWYATAWEKCEKYDWKGGAFHGRRQASVGEGKVPPRLRYRKGGRPGTNRHSKRSQRILPNPAWGHPAAPGRRRKRPGHHKAGNPPRPGRQNIKSHKRG